MCKRNTLAGLLLLLVITIVASTQPSSATAPDHGPAARGSGEFLDLFGERWQFSFEAFANKKGHAHGRAVFENLTEGTQVEVRINCLSTGGINAVMSGVVLHTDDPFFPKSADVFFVAGDDAFPTPLPDYITPLFVNPLPEGNCQNSPLPLTLIRLPGNAIEIEP